MRAIVLAAGEGIRLRPLTISRSKHMIIIAGKPILERIFLILKECGIKEIFVVVNYLEEKIQQYFGSGEKLGISITYIHQDRVMGTANAIASVERILNDDNFIVVYGDLILEPSILTSLIDKHKKKGLMTMGVVPVEEPSHYGIIRLKDGFVEEIIEKPQTRSYGNLANAGIYIFYKEIFEEIKNTQTSARGEIEITDTIQTLLKKGVKIVGSEIKPEKWLDVGVPWTLLEANKRILENEKLEIKGDVEKNAYLFGKVGVEEGTKVRSGTYIEGPVFIGRQSDIGPNSYIRPFTSIGNNVRIGNACEVKNSIVFNGTHIGHLSYFGDSIIGENCNFGAGTIIANLRLDEKKIRVEVKGKMMDTGMRKFGIVTGDEIKTGIGVKIMPGVKIGQQSWIGPGVTVYKDIPYNTVVIQKQELDTYSIK